MTNFAQQNGTGLDNVYDVLSRIAEKILVNEDLTQTSDNILLNLRKNLDVFGCGILLPEPTGTYLRALSYSNTKTIDYFIRFIRPAIFNFKFPIADEKLLLCKCYRDNAITQSFNIQDFFSPIIPAGALEFIQKTAKLQECIAIPIRVMGKPTGVLFAVFRKRLTDTELSLFQFYANLSGLALENHQKLSQLKRQFEMEKTTTSVLSHELKTPIAIAHNSVQLLKYSLERIEDDLPYNKYKELTGRVSEVQEDLNRILRICNSIFILREVEAHVPLDIHVLNLQTQLKAIVDNFERLAQKSGLRLEAVIESNNSQYHGGIVQLEQIITILLDNAIKYTKRGEVKLWVGVKNGKLTTTVTDTGEGIPEKDRQKIFEQYYRRHQGLGKRTEGLGLGLYIAKKIVDKLDGKIIVANNPQGKGSEFTVELPVFLKK